MKRNYVITIESDETIDGQLVWWLKIDGQLASIAYTKTEVCHQVATLLERDKRGEEE